MLMPPGRKTGEIIRGAAERMTAMRAGAKALVVEDEPLIRMTICDMLEESGFAFAEAGNGRDALAQLENDPEFEVLIMDLGLPGMSGEELIAEVHRVRPGMKIVVASGHSAEVRKGNPAYKGVVFLEKPFDLQQLQEAIAAA